MPVAIGSRALVGSSNRRISGSVASARAMQSRCCCPPDRAERGLVQAVLGLVPERGAAEACSTLSAMIALVAHAAQAQAVGDVLEDRLGERVGLLEDHADAHADFDRVDASADDVDAVGVQRGSRPRSWLLG